MLCSHFGPLILLWQIYSDLTIQIKVDQVCCREKTESEWKRKWTTRTKTEINTTRANGLSRTFNYTMNETPLQSSQLHNLLATHVRWSNYHFCDSNKSFMRPAEFLLINKITYCCVPSRKQSCTAMIPGQAHLTPQICNLSSGNTPWNAPNKRRNPVQENTLPTFLNRTSLQCISGICANIVSA